MPNGTSGPRPRARNDQLQDQEVKSQGHREAGDTFGGIIHDPLGRVGFLVF